MVYCASGLNPERCYSGPSPDDQRDRPGGRRRPSPATARADNRTLCAVRGSGAGAPSSWSRSASAILSNCSRWTARRNGSIARRKRDARTALLYAVQYCTRNFLRSADFYLLHQSLRGKIQLRRAHGRKLGLSQLERRSYNCDWYMSQLEGGVMAERRRRWREVACDVCGKRFQTCRSAWLCSARCRQTVCRQRARASRVWRGEVGR